LYCRTLPLVTEVVALVVLNDRPSYNTNAEHYYLDHVPIDDADSEAKQSCV